MRSINLLVALMLVSCLNAGFTQSSGDPPLRSYKAFTMNNDESDLSKRSPLISFTLKKSNIDNIYGVTGTVYQGTTSPPAVFSGSYFRKSKKLAGKITKFRDTQGKPSNIELEDSGTYDTSDKSFDLTISRPLKGGVQIWYRYVIGLHSSDSRLKPNAGIQPIPGKQPTPESTPFSVATSWAQNTEKIGYSTWIVKDEGNGYFSAKESGLGGAVASKVTWNGSTLRIEFDSKGGWAGYYEWTIDTKKGTGEGYLTVTRGRVGTYKSTEKKG